VLTVNIFGFFRKTIDTKKSPAMTDEHMMSTTTTFSSTEGKVYRATHTTTYLDAKVGKTLFCMGLFGKPKLNLNSFYRIAVF
jgi:hypothetical protein